MPLRLEILDDKGKPHHIHAGRVVIYDGITDTPISIAHEFSPGICFATCAGNEDFESTLRALGVDRTVIVEKIDPDNLPRV
jgi:hypothetical protein